MPLHLLPRQRESPAECLLARFGFRKLLSGELTVRCSTQILFCAALLMSVPAAQAEDASTATPAPSAPSSLVLHFDPGSATVRQQDITLLDQASRLYRAGNPIVMIVTGSADTVGAAAANLRLSQLRANNVLQGLVSRGIPVERFQVIAKGQTDPVVATEERNRRVEITWR
jgi:outer membrane protein OmpA-like peptidoglycan-associated protein